MNINEAINLAKSMEGEKKDNDLSSIEIDSHWEGDDDVFVVVKGTHIDGQHFVFGSIDDYDVYMHRENGEPWTDNPVFHDMILSIEEGQRFLKPKENRKKLENEAPDVNV